MKRWRGVLLALLTLLSPVCYGQAKKVPVKKDTIRHWEMALDLLSLTNKNQVPATSIFGRYNYVGKKGNCRAWRLRIGINANKYDSAQIAAPKKDEYQTFSPYIRPGFEWQNSISKNASIFYGIDLIASYYRYEYNILFPRPTPSPTPILIIASDKIWQFGAASFMGFKYKPVSWLSLSVESSLNLMYKIRREKDKTVSIDYPNGEGGHSKIDINGFKVYFLPITVFNLSFYLNKK